MTEARPAGADAEALGRLCDRAAPALYALALRIVGSARDAEEVVEQTLLEAWDAGDAEETHAAGLVRRCRGLALVRSGKRSIESTRRPPFAVRPFPLDETAQAEATRTFARLSEDDQRLAARACFEGYSVGEIAARARTTPGETQLGLARILDAFPAGEGPGADRTDAAMALDRDCVLHAFDLLEGAARERLDARLAAGDAALAARIAARARALALLALSLPPARPEAALRARLVGAAANRART